MALGSYVLSASLAVLQHKLVANRFASPLISFAAALGVHPSDRAWRRPSSYTTYLSGLIYCNQVLLVHHVLQQHPPTV